MKTKTTRLLCFLLVILLLPLAACSSNDTTPSESPSASPVQSETPAPQETTPADQPAEPPPGEPEQPGEAPPEEPAPEDNRYEISLPLSEERLDYTFWSGVDPRVVDIVEADNYTDAFKVFGEIGNKTNIFLEVVGVPAFVEAEKFNLMIIAGDYCDIIFGVGSMYTTKISGALEDDIIIDLRDLLEEHAPIYWDTLMASSELKISAFTAEGKIGTIFQIYKEAGTENPGYALRKDWLDEMGVGVPDTVDEFYDYAKYALDEHGAQIYLRAEADFGNLQYALGAQAGSYLRNGEVVNGGVQQEFYEYIEILRKWYAEGLIQEDYYSRDLAESQANFGKGVLSTVVANSAGNMSELYNYALDGRGSMTIAGFGNLTIPGRDTLVVSSANTLIKNGSIWSISRDCDDPVPLMKLLNFLYSDEGSLICNYGVQGESFIINEDGEPEWTDLVLNNPDGLTTTQAMLLNTNMNLPHIHDMSRTYYDFDELQWEAVELFRGDDADQNNLPRELSLYLTTEESERLSLLNTDMESYREEKMQSWICGVIPFDQAAFDEYVNTLYDKLHMQEIEDINAGAYERYLERLAEIG